MSSLIKLKDINKYYKVGKEKFHVLKSLNIDIEEGDFVMIMGKSGSGKTTLLNVLAFLDKFDTGSYFFNYENVSNLNENQRSVFRNKYIGFIFQQFNLIETLSIYQNVELPLLYDGKLNKSERENIVKEKLEQVGLLDKIKSMPLQLSGGQQQRVAIARSLVNNPKLIFADEPTGALDSETSDEIMSLLKDLNNQGKTIIMVTHDADLIKYATRLYDLKMACYMRRLIMSIIKSSLINLKGHKLRVFVTLLWIIMGITSSILVSSIGNGLKKEVTDSVSRVNPNKTRIYFESSDSNMANMETFLNPFKLEDIDELSFIEGVERIGASKDDFSMGSMYYSDAYFDKKTTYVDIKEFNGDDKIVPVFGRSFSYDDDNRKVIIITMQNAIDLFNAPEEALGKGITINNHIYEVIGVIDEDSIRNNAESNVDNMYYGDMNYIYSYMPSKAFNDLMNQFSYPQDIYSLDLVVSKGYDMYEVSNNVINKLYELHPDINGSYNIDDPTEATKELESMVSTINKFVTLITAISMFVGGVGVMNIMYVSVMERQREIGIRRAIGAKPLDILIQFLVEAIFITILGGIIGIVIGFIVVNYASNYLPFKAIPNINSLLFASVTTVVTGTIFGIVPAIKASKLDPIKAIYK